MFIGISERKEPRLFLHIYTKPPSVLADDVGYDLMEINAFYLYTAAAAETALEVERDQLGKENGGCFLCKTLGRLSSQKVEFWHQ